MKSISEVTCLVVDSGLFLPMALRMADDCKRVLYYNPDQRESPSIKQGLIGSGMENVEITLDFWDHLNEIDLFCFPNIGQGGLQLHLESLGKAVWGSRHGDIFEIGRESLMRLLERLGLEVPPYQVCEGLDELRSLLKDKDDCYIKISRWRGDMETKHWRTFAMDEGWLDWMAVNLGPFKRHIRFLVFEKIDTKLEIGGDNYNINGQWPNTMLNGIEGKDKSYFAAVTQRGDMPDQIQDILDVFGPELEQFGYRNQVSFEVRVKDGKGFWGDATQRGGLPSTSSQHLLWQNFPEIVWHGANGELVEPEPAAKFSIETMITTHSDKDTWDSVEIPKELERNASFAHCMFVDGVYAFPPDELHSGDLGWLCAIGDSPREVLDRQKELADMLPDGLNADVEALADVIKEIEEAEKQGVPFTQEEMPQPVEVLE